MKISYAIPVCNEYKEIEYLLDYLVRHIRTEDEIVIQCDQGNTTPEVYKILSKYKLKSYETSLANPNEDKNKTK